ncbi:MAG: alpha/beta fold hydrolase [Caulobacterales bacterium]
MAEAQSLVRRRGRARAAAQGVVIAVLALIAACAPTVQTASRTPRDFAGPAFDVAHNQFKTFDGTRLGLSAWLPPQSVETWGVVIGLHGMNDYGRTFEEAGSWFAERGVATFAYDARGHGRSPNRGVWGGEHLMTEDLRTAVAVARRAYPNATITVVGESMGAATAIAAFGSEAPPGADRVVLVAPAVWGWSSLPDLYALTLRIGAHLIPHRSVTAPRSVAVKHQPSDNIEMLRRLGRDQNMIFETRIDAVYGLVNLMEAASEKSARVNTPALFMYGAHDTMIPRAAAIAAAQSMPPSTRTAYYPDGWHMMLRDLQAPVVFEDILAFMRDSAAPLPSAPLPLIPPEHTIANR